MSAQAHKSGVCLGMGWAMKAPHSTLPDAASGAELRKWHQTVINEVTTLRGWYCDVRSNVGPNSGLPTDRVLGL